MKWIRVTHDFGVPYCTLVLTSREAQTYRQMRGVLTLCQDDPNKLEEEIVKLITELRPELAGGQLIGMDMTGYMQFRFMYYHPKLSRVKNFDRPPEIPLLPMPNEPVSDNPDVLVEVHEDGLGGYIERPYEFRGGPVE